MEKRDDMLNCAMAEIINYVKDKPGASYYDVKAYAYENELENWIALIRNKNTRHCLSLYLRSKREKDKVPYNNSMPDSVMRAIKAEEEYYRNKPSFPAD